jgi:hypothetical protein
LAATRLRSNADYVCCVQLAQGLEAYTYDQIIRNCVSAWSDKIIQPCAWNYRAFWRWIRRRGNQQWLAEVFMDERHPPRLTEMLAWPLTGRILNNIWLNETARMEASLVGFPPMRWPNACCSIAK